MFHSDVSKLSKGSHALVKVECELKVSDNCVNIKEMMYKSAVYTIERNDGKYICLQCSRATKNLGVNNIKCKYDYDRNLLKEIDCDTKAYLLGWISSDGHVSHNNSIVISILKKDLKCLEIIRDFVCEDIPIIEKDNDFIIFTISSKQMCDDVCKHLNIKRGKKDDIVEFPILSSEELGWAFIRGVFDGDGSIRNPLSKTSPDCGISSNSKKMLEAIGKFSKIPYNISHNKLIYQGTNAIDFLGKMYKNSGVYKLERKYETYLQWLNWREYIRGPGNSFRLSQCFLYKTDKNAVFPEKNKQSDVGYDLTIIKEEKKLLNNTTLYDTGIKIRVKDGLYVEVVPRSSLSKSGYILANSIGIIDPNYIGNIFIALTKVDPDAPDLQLPFRCCQMIFKEQIHVDIIETTEHFEETTRGEGGFGSTN